MPSRPAAASISREAPDIMARPEGTRRERQQRQARTEWRLPAWLLYSLVVCFFLVLGTFTANSLMRAWIQENEQAKADAHRAVLDAHPLVYREWIERYAAEYNLQPAFVAALILNESSFRPEAESSVGARGLMQMMPDTAEWIAHKLGMDREYSFLRMYDPESNIRFGCWYLGYLCRLFSGDPVCVACAYHAGQGQVTTWLSDQHLSADGRTLQLEKMTDGPTKNYARRVTQDYGIYQVLYFTPADPSDGGDLPLHASLPL